MHLITENAFSKIRLDVHFEVPRGAALGTLWGVGGGGSLWFVEGGGTLWGVGRGGSLWGVEGGSTLWGAGGGGPSVKKQMLTQNLSKKAWK